MSNTPQDSCNPRHGLNCFCGGVVLVLQEGSTALHMVTKGAMSDPGSRRSMVRMVVGAGVDPEARDKVRP